MITWAVIGALCALCYVLARLLRKAAANWKRAEQELYMHEQICRYSENDILTVQATPRRSDGQTTTVGEIVLPKLGKRGISRLLEAPKGDDVVDGEWEEA